jgi:hypothetical protein
VTIGTDAGEVWEGAEPHLQVFEPMRDRFAAMEGAYSVDFLGGIRARLTGDGETGFVATTTDAAVGEHRLPSMRVACAFSLIDSRFRLVCDHHSIPAMPAG